jgi:transposase
MPAPISMDLRLRIVGAVEGGSSIREAARRFALSPSAAIKLMQRVRATGSVAPPRYGVHRPLLEPHEADLRRLVGAAAPDLTLAELQTELQRRCGVRAGLSTIPNALRRSGLRHKQILKSGRAGPPRCRRPAPAVAGLAALHGPGALRLTRRDRYGHQHGAALWPQPLRRAPGRRRAPGASVAFAILAEAGLSFLGLGTQPPTPSWGADDSRLAPLSRAAWTALVPGVAVALTVLGLNMPGDVQRDALDPTAIAEH